MQFNTLRALVVDDNKTDQLIAQECLKAIQITSSTAFTGPDAIRLLSKETFDFVLMDISMPGQDGVDAVRWIRDMNDAKIKVIPIFALTSHSTEAHGREILEAGFNAHLAKPLSIEKLEPLLKKHFWSRD